MRRLEGKNAVITGAAGGIGRAACERFLAEGASVLAVDIDAAGCGELQSELSNAENRFEIAACDVTDAASVSALATLATSHFGHVEVLFNNAGVILGKPLMETSEDEWDNIQAVNAKSAFLLTKAFVPLMENGGSIINVSSIGGIVAFANMSAYGAAKGAVAMFSRAAAVDLAPKIRVNAICPGVIDTQMPHNFLKHLPEKQAIWQHWNEMHLVGRVGKPAEVAALVAYLASDEASFMTGAVLPIDGGWSTV